MDILNVEEKEIRKYVEEHEKEYGYGEFIYFRCVDDIKNVDPCKLKEEDVKGPIRVFLINWGMMGRVLRGRYKGWENRLLKLLTENKDICKTINKLRKEHLEDADLSNLRSDIERCYEEVRKIVGPTSTSKLLHLLCPNFFPLWDENIRKKVGVRDSKSDYYNFICIIQRFIKKYDEVISELSEKHGCSKLRIVDKYLWLKCNKD